MFKTLIIASAALSVVVSANEFDTLDKTHCTPEQRGARICPANYLPVCGSDRRVHSNACNACAGIEVDFYVVGTCESLGIKPAEEPKTEVTLPTPVVPVHKKITCPPGMKKNRFCPQNYLPVCGSDNRTHSNKCHACSGSDAPEFYMEGTCASLGIKEAEVKMSLPTPVVPVHKKITCPPGMKKNRFCPQNYLPVCGSDNRTHSNKCHACSGADASEFYMQGTCASLGIKPAEDVKVEVPSPKVEISLPTPVVPVHKKITCNPEMKKNRFCPQNYFPVCGSDNRTHSNECHACSGADAPEFYMEGTCASLGIKEAEN